MEGLGKTIRNGTGFERVRLTDEEMDEVHQEVMAHNAVVVRDCITKADEEFGFLESAPRLHVALLLADKACVARFTVEKEKLDSKVNAIKDAANGGGQR